MNLQELERILEEKHARVLELAAQRHAKKKEMAAAYHGIVWGNSIGVARYPNNFDVIFDDMEENPYLNMLIQFMITSCDEFYVRRILKSGKPSDKKIKAAGVKKIIGVVNPNIPNPQPANEAELKAICSELNKIHNELIEAAKERLKAWEDLFQAQNNWLFGASVVNYYGKEYLIKGVKMSSYVNAKKIHKVIACQILKSGKVSNNEKIIALYDEKEVRRLKLINLD